MLRDIYLEILKSLNRFLAIVIIVALGVAFLYGMHATAPAMRYTADKYFDRQQHRDLRLVSTLGFNAADVEELQKQDYVRQVAATYTMDALIESANGTNSARIHALASEDSVLDRPMLVEGHWAEGSGECLVDSKQAGVMGQIGSRISISEKNKPEVLAVFPTRQYTISGFVQSPEYINYENRGSMSIGDGSIFGFIYVPAENFKLDYYTDLIVTIQGAEELSSYTDAYDKLITDTIGKLKELAQIRADIHYQEIIDAANRELAQAEQQLQNASLTQGPGTSTGPGDLNQSIQSMAAQIQEKRQAIAKIPKPQWLILSRQDNADYTSFGDTATRLDALASVFPVFFYLIAALVCLTTLTRMVEEQRTQMGVFRALGFSKAAVISKYLIYASSASLIGSGIGLMLGHYLLPYLMFRPFEYAYTIPPLEVPFILSFALIASLAAILINTLAAFWACSREISSLPAELIRPKAPAPGHRVLLERIPLLWRRFSFLVKFTVRNLFRFKKRFFMTVLGIAGCTALILTGFGLRDSIIGTVPRQFYGLHSYHLFINLVSPASRTDSSGLNRSLPDLLDDWLYTTNIKVRVEGLDKKMTTYLFVAEEPAKTGDFIHFRERKSHAPVTFPQAGKVILTEKIASELGVQTGDIVRFGPEGDNPVQAEVGGVIENYIYNYIFISPDDYTALFGSPPLYNMVLGQVGNGETLTEPQEKELTSAILKQDNVISATTIAAIRREFDEAMQDLNAVVLVLIVGACLLNFVVLYNLVNINITERTREIATIKVLGFLKREIHDYINWEILVLMVIGILLGLAGGYFLHLFTIQQAEMDYVMYAREIHPLSYLWSVLLTVLFTIIVSLTTRIRLGRIKMVESLKSVE